MFMFFIFFKVEQVILCAASVEPNDRDVGRRIVRECPSQEALEDFLQSEGATGGQTSSGSPSGFASLFNSSSRNSAVGNKNFSVSKLGDLVAQEMHQREREIKTPPPPQVASPKAAGIFTTNPASNESGYKSSPNPSDPGFIQNYQFFSYFVFRSIDVLADNRARLPGQRSYPAGCPAAAE